MSGDRVIIFDTTLRDGEQAPGFSMSEAAKLRVAKALARLQVDVIEAGFAAASPGDARAIAAIAAEVDGPVIASLARATQGDIEAAARALETARRKRIHIFLGTSPLHREAKLKMSHNQVIEAIGRWVGFARELCDDIEFSAEDAIRTEQDFLAEALSVAAEAGARTLNVPDTVGYATPDEMTRLFAFLKRTVRRADDVVFSAHCHNDLGMAVANSLAAVRGGARQIECSLNGIGERAGNTALEEVVMALRTRVDSFGVTTGVDTRAIMAASRTLVQATNCPPPRNKAIIGANAFAHESGIHQHGVLQNRETYEIMRPADIGLDTDGIVLGKHSGRHAFAERARALGFAVEGEALDRAFAAFKDMADEVGIIDTARLMAILSQQVGGGTERLWALHSVEIRGGESGSGCPVAAVTLDHGSAGRQHGSAAAAGGMDAAFLAINRITGVAASVEQLDLQYVAADRSQPASDGHSDGQGADVLVEIGVSVADEIFTGRARARDILPCCVSAYVDAVSNADAVMRYRRDMTLRQASAA